MPFEPDSPASVIPLRTRLAACPNLLPLPFHFDIRNAVLLAGSPRSGTTWLGQVLATAPELCLVNEPFSPKMPGLSHAGFSWRPYREPEEEWPTGERVVRRILTGRGVTIKLIRRNGPKLLRGEGVLVKEVLVNRLLPWLVPRFSLRGIVLIVRHPCAVVSSQLLNFQLKDLSRQEDLDYVDRYLPTRSTFARSLQTETERRALTWSLDQHAAGLVKSRAGVISTSYEELVLRGRPQVDHIFEFLQLRVPKDAIAMLEANSWQAREGSVDHARATVEERLGVWKKRLEPEQVERILRVAEACGIRGFTDRVLPDFELLRSY